MIAAISNSSDGTVLSTMPVQYIPLLVKAGPSPSMIPSRPLDSGRRSSEFRFVRRLLRTSAGRRNLPHLHAHAVGNAGTFFGEGDRTLHACGLHDEVASNRLLRLGKGAVRDVVLSNG